MAVERRPPRLLHRAAYTVPFSPTSQEQASSHKQKPTGQYFTSSASLQGARKQQQEEQVRAPAI